MSGQGVMPVVYRVQFCSRFSTVVALAVVSSGDPSPSPHPHLATTVALLPARPSSCSPTMVSYTMYPEEGQTSFSRSRNAMSPQAMQASGLGGAALHEGHEGHRECPSTVLGSSL